MRHERTSSLSTYAGEPEKGYREGSGQQPLLFGIYAASQREKDGISRKAPVAYVAGDRRKEGVFPLWTTRQNMTVARNARRSGLERVLSQTEKEWTESWRGKIGDGDHGINMAKGFNLIKGRLGDKEVTLSEGLGLIGKTLMTEIGGSMGPIYGTFFIQMSLKSKDKPETDGRLFGEMLKAAREALEDLGGAKVGDKTHMDAVIPAQAAYQEAVDAGASLPEALKTMAEAAEKGKDSTADLVAKIGRSARLGERSRGVLDAGATSAALILQTFATTLSA
jgi:dihydroxyacetone kinase-like protein